MVSGFRGSVFNERLCARILLVLSALTLFGVLLQLNELVGLRTGYWQPDSGSHTLILNPPPSDIHSGESVARTSSNSIDALLMFDPWLRPLGILFHAFSILAHPFLRPMGFGPEGLLLFSFGRWASQLLAALAGISACLTLLRWKQSSDRLCFMGSIVFLLLVLAAIYPLLNLRYFIPAMVFLGPLCLGLPSRLRNSFGVLLLCVLLMVPFGLLLAGIPLPGIGADQDFEAYQFPYLPGYAPPAMPSE